MTPTIHTTDNRHCYGYYSWAPSTPRGIVVQRWRPSLLWRVGWWWERINLDGR